MSDINININRNRRSRQRQSLLLKSVLILVILVLGIGVYTFGFADDSDEINKSEQKTVVENTRTVAEVASSSGDKSADNKAETPVTDKLTSLDKEPANNNLSQLLHAQTGKEVAGYSIRIDKGDYQLYLLQDGKMLKSYPIAVGKNAGQKEKRGDNKTPTGVFPVDEVLDASYWTHDFGDGKGEIEGAYGPYFISLDTYAMSGGAWDGIGIHGTHDPDSIGTMVSEGCIRMHNEDLLDLYQYIKVGMSVAIEE